MVGLRVWLASVWLAASVCGLSVWGSRLCISVLSDRPLYRLNIRALTVSDNQEYL